MATFSGFPRDGLALLGRLPALDKEGFRAERARYAEGLQAPLRAFVEALGPALREAVSPGLRYAAKTHGSIGPINNDVRFDPDAPTYKDHVLLRFWEGEDKKTAPTLFVRLGPSEVGFAAGAAFGDVARWRAAVDRDGAALARALDALVAETGAELVGRTLKRVPKPYDPEHPRGDLLRHRRLQLRWPRPHPAGVGTADFVAYCAGELARAAPVHRWLVAHLG